MRKKTSKSQSIFHSFLDIFGRLPGGYQKQFWALSTFALFVSILEMVSVGSIALFATVISSPKEILHSKYALFIRQIWQVDYLYTVHGIILSMSVIMVLVIVLKNGFRSLNLYLSTLFCARVDAFVGDILFKGFIDMPYEWHLSQNSADIVIALEWRNNIGFNLMNASLRIMNEGFLVLFLLGALIFVQPYISMALLFVGVGGAVVIFRKTYSLQMRQAKRCVKFGLSLNRHATKGIHGIKDIKVSGRASFAQDFKNEAYHYAQAMGLRNLFVIYPVVIMEILSIVMLAGLVCFMVFFNGLSTAQITGSLSLFVVTAWKVFPAINKILSNFSKLRNSLPAIKLELDHLENIDSNEKDKHVVDTKASPNFTFDSEIRFENVSFLYENTRRYVLEDISCYMNKGQTIGLVGRSGAGKSTLADIFIGLLEPSKGKILFDGHELNGAKRSAWMKKVGYVPQSPYIYDGSLLGNVAFGLRDSEIDRDLVLECCKMASMEDVLDDLPQGIDTLIGERGVRLSGGQQQRVVIARALYSRPEVMIFDEATSSLDAKSEKGIQDTIYRLGGKQTLIIIAHRLSTVEDCDELIWLEKGRVRQIGTPGEILPTYSRQMLQEKARMPCKDS